MNTQFVCVIQTVRLRLGARLLQVKSLFDEGKAAEVEEKTAEFASELNTGNGFLAGFVFGLKSALPADRFAAAMRAAGVGDEELSDMLSVAAKMTGPDQEQQRN